MSEERSDHELNDIDSQLRDLRDALKALRVPAGHEQALRSALRARLGTSVEAAPGGTTPVASAASSAEHRATTVSWRSLRPAGYALAASVAAASALWLLGSSGPAVDSSVDEPASVADRGSQPRQNSGGLADDTLAEAPATASASGFEPVVYESLYESAGAPLSESYVVVRVRAPVALLGLETSASIEGTIEADMLIGEDGLVAGVRFDEAMFESAAR